MIRTDVTLLVIAVVLVLFAGVLSAADAALSSISGARAPSSVADQLLGAHP